MSKIIVAVLDYKYQKAVFHRDRARVYHVTPESQVRFEHAVANLNNWNVTMLPGCLAVDAPLEVTK